MVQQLGHCLWCAHPMLECPGLSLSSTSHPASCWRALGDVAGAGSSTRLFAIHFGDSDWVLGSWLHPCPVLAVVGVLGVNQQMEDLHSVSLSPSKMKINFKKIKFEISRNQSLNPQVILPLPTSFIHLFIQSSVQPVNASRCLSICQVWCQAGASVRTGHLPSPFPKNLYSKYINGCLPWEFFFNFIGKIKKNFFFIQSHLYPRH